MFHRCRNPGSRPGPRFLLKPRLQLTCALAVQLVAIAALGCAGGTVEVPVFDPLHPPLLLTENRTIAMPASDDPNRMISGWRDVRRSQRHQPRFKAVGRGRLQVVQLAPRSRVLQLELAGQPPTNAQLDVRFADRAWRRLPLEAQMAFDLPGDFAGGRVSVDLRPVGDANLLMRAVKLSAALPPGEVEVRGGDLIQSGDSVVEVVHRLSGRSRLTGRLQPPTDVEPGQAFHLEMESAAGGERVVSWASDAGSQRASSKGRATSFDLRLPAQEFVRLRFVAEGHGEPARWRDLVLRTPPPAAEPSTRLPQKRPRLVVLYVMDALRADHLEHLGGPRGISPTIDRLAAQGATFLNHFSSAPNTVPSTKSLLTGNRYLVKGGTKLTPESGATLAERYSDAGYAAALFSSNGNVGGFRGMARGYLPGHARILWRSNNERKRSGYNNSAEVLHREALAWLDSLADGQPAFLHVQTVNPHNPYDPPEPFRSRFVPDNGSQIDGGTKTLKAIQRQRRRINRADQERLKGLYAAGVAYNDAVLQDFLVALKNRYAAEDILLLLTSDHGEELFDHGGVLHGYTLYDEMLRVPLVVWWPGTVAGGAEVGDLTDTVDVHATLAGLVSDPREPLAGDSLWSYLLGGRVPKEHKDVVFAAASSLPGGLFMARSDGYKVVFAPRGRQHRWGMGQGRGRGFDAEYVFDLAADPAEMSNIAGRGNLETDWLRQRLQAWVAIGKDLETGENLEAMDESTRESLEALGYL